MMAIPRELGSPLGLVPLEETVGIRDEDPEVICLLSLVLTRRLLPSEEVVEVWCEL